MATLDLYLNGELRSFAADLDSVDSLFEALDIRSKGKIVELNGRIIQPEHYANTGLQSHDRIEIIQFMGGGG